MLFESGIVELHRNANPASIEPTVAAAEQPLRLQFKEMPRDAVLSAAADALARHPETELRAYGFGVDPTLEWLSGFEHIEHLTVDLIDVTSFDALARCKRLRSLDLGETSSRRPSLAFLRELPRLEHLFIEGHDKDFEAVGDIPGLRSLALRVCRAKSLDALRGHASIEVLAMEFGGLRDLTPLADLPRLRGLELYQVRKLDTDDLDPVAECKALEAVSLGALRNVDSLRALAGGPRETLRLLTLEGLTGLETLADLTRCARLEQLGLYDSRPADRRLDVLLECPSLKGLIVGDVYPQEQFDAIASGFSGESLRFGGETVRGGDDDLRVEWRTRVVDQLGMT
jgi:hypothetical protein